MVRAAQGEVVGRRTAKGILTVGGRRGVAIIAGPLGIALVALAAEHRRLKLQGVAPVAVKIGYGAYGIVAAHGVAPLGQRETEAQGGAVGPLGLQILPGLGKGSGGRRGPHT